MPQTCTASADISFQPMRRWKLAKKLLIASCVVAVLVYLFPILLSVVLGLALYAIIYATIFLFLWATRGRWHCHSDIGSRCFLAHADPSATRGTVNMLADLDLASRSAPQASSALT